MTNIFLGNLSYENTASDLAATLSEFGQVDRASVVRGRDNNRW